MKWLKWGITLALLALVLGTVAAYYATRETSRPRAKNAASSAAQTPLVDERPLPTARALAALAITPEEQRLAEEAVRIAVHEVDLAFADELRQEKAKRAPVWDQALPPLPIAGWSCARLQPCGAPCRGSTADRDCWAQPGSIRGREERLLQTCHPP